MGTEGIEAAIAALYLPGLGPRGLARRTSGAVIAALRRAESPGRAAALLRRTGHPEEAAALDAPGLLDRAEALVRAGRVLTALDPTYPAAWRTLGAPPAVWREGDAPSGRVVAVVGSRDLSPEEERFAREVGARAEVVVSGGARGADLLAMGAARAAVEIVPGGLRSRPPGPAGLRLSAEPPDAPFSRAAAMARNALVHAYGERSVVVAVRFREGGTWHGATDALRRRRAVFVRRSEGPGPRALVALGARWAENAEDALEGPTGALLGA